MNLLLGVSLVVDDSDIARSKVVLARSAEASGLFLTAKTLSGLHFQVVGLLVRWNGIHQLAMQSHEILLICAGQTYICLRRWPLLRVLLLALVALVIVLAHLC